MQRKKTKLNRVFPVTGLSLMLLLVFAKVALGEWSQGLTEAQNFGLPEAGLYEIITNILDWILTIVGVVGIIGFAIAGIMYLTSAGDDKRIETAKKAMTASIIGVIVAIAGMVVLVAVDNMLNGNMLF